MAFSYYRVKLNPIDDAHVEYHGCFGAQVKMLTENEASTIREMIKEQVGKTVGKVGALDGEQYEIMSTFPTIRDLHTFLRGLENKSISYDTYYHEKYTKNTKPQTSSTTYQCSPAMVTCDGVYPPPPM